MAESIGQKLIAEKAGVSRTTVSVVLNNRPTPVISEKTRRRVLKVAKSMGYRPRPRISFTTGTHNLGVFLGRGPLGSYGNPLYGPILEAVEQEAALHGFHLIFAMPENRPGRGGPALLAQNKCDGALLIGPARERLLEALQNHQLPTVAVLDAPPDIESVVADHAKAARIAVEYLVKRGHRGIAYLGADRSQALNASHFDAFRLAILDHDLDLRRDLTFEVRSTHDGGHEVAEKLVERLAGCTAAVCATDQIALGLIAGLRALGTRVPEEIGVIGMDDLPESQRAGLTTIAVPLEDMGRLAVKKLFAKLSGDDTPPSRSVVDVSLVDRRTVANLKPETALL